MQWRRVRRPNSSPKKELLASGLAERPLRRRRRLDQLRIQKKYREERLRKERHGESRWLMIWGQIDGSSNGVLIVSFLSVDVLIEKK